MADHESETAGSGEDMAMAAQNAEDMAAAATRQYSGGSHFRPDCAPDRANSLRCIEEKGKEHCDEFFETYKSCMRGLRDAKAKARQDKGFFH